MAASSSAADSIAAKIEEVSLAEGIRRSRSDAEGRRPQPSDPTPRLGTPLLTTPARTPTPPSNAPKPSAPELDPFFFTSHAAPQRPAPPPAAPPPAPAPAPTPTPTPATRDSPHPPAARTAPSVGEMKKALRDAGVDVSNVFERDELVAKYEATMAARGSVPAAAPPAPVAPPPVASTSTSTSTSTPPPPPPPQPPDAAASHRAPGAANTPERDDIVNKAEAWVKREMSRNDPSHDWWHVHRVRVLALTLAREEGVTEDVALEIVEVAALLHDVKDYKYSGSENAGALAVRSWLQANSMRYSLWEDVNWYVDAIVLIVARVGFKNELKSESAGAGDGAAPLSEKRKKELADAEWEEKHGAYARSASLRVLCGCVQDADRLDAMGAIGIARTFSYGGARGSPMHDPGISPREGDDLTRERYVAGNTAHGGPGSSSKGFKAGAGAGARCNTTINHFHEKLLKLAGMMKTASGYRRAMVRHDTMTRFLEDFEFEWNGIL